MDSCTTNEEIEEICAKNTKPVALEKNESLLVSYTSYYRRGRAVRSLGPSPPRCLCHGFDTVNDMSKLHAPYPRL